MSTVAVMDNVLENLAAAMKEKNISQSELARRADVRQATISDLFRGKFEPSVAIIEKLAKALGVRADAIFLTPESKKA